MFITADAITIENVVKSILSKKPSFSNYFGVDLDNVEYVLLQDTLILKKKYDLYTRIYFLSSNSVELINILSQLGELDVINIPTKKGLSAEVISIINRSGYTQKGVYERMYNNSIYDSLEFIKCYGGLEDVDTIFDIIYNNFNPYLDHLPSRKELEEIIVNRQVIVNRDDDNIVTGVLIFTVERSKLYMNCLIETSKKKVGCF